MSAHELCEVWAETLMDVSGVFEEFAPDLAQEFRLLAVKLRAWECPSAVDELTAEAERQCMYPGSRVEGDCA